MGGRKSEVAGREMKRKDEGCVTPQAVSQSEIMHFDLVSIKPSSTQMSPSTGPPFHTRTTFHCFQGKINKIQVKRPLKNLLKNTFFQKKTLEAPWKIVYNDTDV